MRGRGGVLAIVALGWAALLLSLTSWVASANAQLTCTGAYCCPTGWTYLASTRRCFHHNPGLLKNSEALTYCRLLTETATLADIRSADEQTVVNNMCRTNSACPPIYTLTWSSSNTLSVPSPAQSCCCNYAASYPTTTNWCVDSSNACYNTNNQGGCSSGRTLCAPASVTPVNPSGSGRGACWVGALRDGAGPTSEYAITWRMYSTSVSTQLTYSNWESNLRAQWPTPTPQPLYVRGSHPPSSEILANRLPQCMLNWNFRANGGRWVVAKCDDAYPSVCAQESVCAGSYYKTAVFAVTAPPSPTITPPTCTLCPGGTYRSQQDGEVACTDCPPGYYGAADSTTRTSSVCSGMCPAGKFCAGRTTTPSECPIGTYGIAPGGWATEGTACAACPAGYYCNTLGNDVARNPAKRCAAGFCGMPGQTQATCSLQCPAGYYCPATQGSACLNAPNEPQITRAIPCGAGYYCPTGSSARQTLQPGQYASSGGGTVTTGSYNSDCEPGYYCPGQSFDANAGLRIPCPAGKYSSLPKQSVCLDCAAGYFCPAPLPGQPGSTSATLNACGAGMPYPTEWFCPAGSFERTKINDEWQSLPVSALPEARSSQQVCPTGKVCARGIAADRLSWTSATCDPVTKTGTGTLNENWAQSYTELNFTAAIYEFLNFQDYDIVYSLESQAFHDPLITECVSTVNDGIFSLDPLTGRLNVLRFDPDPRDPSKALQYEACPTQTDIRYRLEVKAVATTKAGVTPFVETDITCSFLLKVGDTNDKPVFPNTIEYRILDEKAEESTVAGRCTEGSDEDWGCPLDATGGSSPVVATDQDYFDLGFKNYSFVGDLDECHSALKINDCTGLIQVKGYPSAPINFAASCLHADGPHRYLEYTVLLQDNGNDGKFPVLSDTTTVRVYIRNINDRPRFKFPNQIFTVSEERTVVELTPNTIEVEDDDPDDEITLTLLSSLDGAFFEITNNVLRKSQRGIAEIDYEGRKSYRIDVLATDNNAAPLSVQNTFTVNIVNANDPPVITTNLMFYVKENAPDLSYACRNVNGICPGTPTPLSESLYALTASDIDHVATDVTWFTITNSSKNAFVFGTPYSYALYQHSNYVRIVRGQLASFDFENETDLLPGGPTGRQYTFGFRATSDGVGIANAIPQSVTGTITVAVVDVNEAPVFVTSAATPFRLVETWPAATTVNHVVISAIDPDNADINLLGAPAPVQKLTFSVSPVSAGARDGSAFFAVSTSNVVGLTQAVITLKAPLNYEAAYDCSDIGLTRCYELRVRVTDDGRDNGLPNPLWTDRVFVFEVVDVNEPPKFALATFQVSYTEDVSTLAISSQVDATAVSSLDVTDPDLTPQAYTYEVVGGDGQYFFTVLPDSTVGKFKIAKVAGGYVSYEQRTSWQLVIKVSDSGPTSSKIGAACVLNQGVSEGCDSGTFCQSSRCYETCATWTNGPVTYTPGTVPRRDIYFCADMASQGFTSSDYVPFKESATATVQITVVNANDPPFIETNTTSEVRPSLLTIGQGCQLRGTVTQDRVVSQGQVAISQMFWYDEDGTGNGPWRGPMVFSQDGGSLWSKFTITNAALGTVVLPQGATGIVAGDFWLGSVRITDEGGAYSNCDLNVSIILSNAPPSLGPDRVLAGLLESSLPNNQVLVFDPPWRNNLTMVDEDHPNGDNPVFSMTFSSQFAVGDTTIGSIVQSGFLDYETAQSVSLLLRVVDRYGADAVLQLTVPIIDVNEPPVWSQFGQAKWSLPENSLQGYVIRNLSALASDPDVLAVDPAWRTLSYTIASGCPVATCPFVIVGNELRVASPTPVLDFESVIPDGPKWNLVLRVSDGPGLFADMNVEVSLTDVNEPPVIAPGAGVSVNEGEAGTDLGSLASVVSDPDAADPISSLIMSITAGDVNNRFEIIDGHLFVRAGATLDFEDVSAYTLSLTVTDSVGHVVSGDFTVTVLNVDDVTIASVSVIETTASSPSVLACSGATSSKIRIVGTNFGMKSGSPEAEVVVTYKRRVSAGEAAVSPTYTAVDCEVTVSNTVIECLIPPTGVGRSLIFTLRVTVPTTTIVNNGVAFASNYVSAIHFDSPVITSGSASLTNMPTGGGVTFDLIGTCFGSSANDNLIFGGATRDSFVTMTTMGYGTRAFPTGACVALSPTTIRCTDASLVGLGLTPTWTVGVALNTAASVQLGNYARPVITQASHTLFPANGVISNGPIVFDGQNLGPLGTVPVMTLTYTDSIAPATASAVWSFTNCVVATAHTRVECAGVSPGVGAGLTLRATILDQTSDPLLSPVFAYIAPNVTAVGGDGAINAATIGGQLVTLSGTNFGPTCGIPGPSIDSGAVNCPRVRASYSRGSLRVSTGQPLVYVPAVCAVVATGATTSQIVCATTPGTGEKHTWRVSVGGQEAFVSPTAGTTSYAAPSVGAYADPVGGTVVSSALTEGGQQIALVGAQFGPLDGANITAFYGNDANPTEFTATNCHVVAAHTRIICTTAVGGGDAISWTVYVDGQKSRAQLSNYGAPTITNVQKVLASVASPATGLREDGQEMIWLTGTNFARPFVTTFLEAVTYGPIAQPTLYDALSGCTVLSHTRIQCSTLPGVGSGLVWRVRVRGQTSASSSVTSSYSPPSLSTINRVTGPTKGGFPIRLTGQGFGLCATGVNQKIVFGTDLLDFQNTYVGDVLFNRNTQCPLPLSFTANRTLEFAAPDMYLPQASYLVYLTVSSPATAETGPLVTTTKFLFTYEPPVVENVYAEPGPTPGSIAVTLVGRNFCRSESCCPTYLDNNLASSRVTSHDHERITIVADTPGNIVIQCPGGSTLPSSFDTSNPFVFGAVAVDTPTSNIGTLLFDTRGLGRQLYVYGIFFSNSGNTVTIGGVDAPVIARDEFQCDDTTPGLFPNTIESIRPSLTPGQTCYRLTVQVPEGQGLNNPLVVTAGALKSLADDTRFEFLSYALQTITGLSTSFAAVEFPTAGAPGATLTVTGLNFGVSGSILFGNAGQFEVFCDANSPGYSWSHTQVSCGVPPGSGRNLQVRIRSGSRVSAPFVGGGLTYAAPNVVSWVLVNGAVGGGGATEGGDLLRISGSNFGRPTFKDPLIPDSGVKPTITLGSTPCDLVDSTHTQITCTTRAGEGRGFRVSVELAGGVGLAPTSVPLFGYGVPLLYGVSPFEGRTDGMDSSNPSVRQIITLQGRNFGVDTVEVSFRLNGQNVLFAKRSSKDNVDQFLYPGTNHTHLRFYLRPLLGANLPISVTVAGQNLGNPGLTFSYKAPVINSGGVSTSQGRRLEGVRRALQEDPQIDNDEWTSNGFGACTLAATNGTVSADYAFRSAITVGSDGSYVRTVNVYSIPNSTWILGDAVANITTQGPSLATVCGDNTYFVGQVVSTGKFVDIGELPNVTCTHVYEQTQETLTVPPTLTRGVPTNAKVNAGFGLYVISDGYRAFLSQPVFPSADDARAAAGTSLNVDFDFEGGPDFSRTAGPLTSTMQKVPTSGCLVWEEDSEYKARVENAFLQNGQTQLPRKCELPALVTITGENFGNDEAEVPGSLRVYLLDASNGIEFEASTTTSGGNHNLLCSQAMNCVHEDTKITFQVPFGSGRNLRIKLVVGGQIFISEPLIDYFGPLPTEVTPGTMLLHFPMQTALGGESILISGTNLGYLTSPFSVMLNGKYCSNPVYISGESVANGQSSIQCVTNPDTAGVRSLFVCVQGQGYVTSVARVQQDHRVLQSGDGQEAWSVGAGGQLNVSLAVNVRSLNVARCPPGFHGRIGEPCLPCPQGGICPGNFKLPRPQASYALIEILRSSERAQGGACDPMRVFPENVMAEYPTARFFDTCHQIVRCIPEEACPSAQEGGNEKQVCAEGYTYQYDACMAVTANMNRTCRIRMDPMTGLLRGMHEDCRGSSAGAMENNQRVCDVLNPEHCSSCQVVYDDISGGSARGVCSCDMPPRCALCTIGSHYRLNNECVECPDNPALVLSLFIIAAVSSIAFAYYLQKKKVNLAFISVGIDYFQVLAILATTNVPWPKVVEEIFRIFSIFLASIDVAAPECLVPSLEFSVKFYMTELMPLAALGILFAIHWSFVLYKLYRQGRATKWLSHVSRLVGIYVMIVYVLYLSCTKKALDVFNCNPLDPDDGFSYTSFASLQCDGGGLCRCNEAGGIQESLQAPAIAFLMIYTFGFPFVCAVILYTHRFQIEEDQYLRAHGVGDRRDTNPRAYDTRKRFQLMYMHFKPQYLYWILVILLRKFGIAFAALMFRGNPSFQLAVILIVLFINFTLQVRYRPYMSPGEFPVVVKELNDASKRALDDEEYLPFRELHRRVGESVRADIELSRKEKMTRHKLGAGFWEGAKEQAKENDRRSRAEKYFFDLNAVEAILLGSTIIMALSGIMFESNRFQTDPSTAWQGDMVVFLILIFLFGSLFYYIAVFVNEFFPVCFSRICGRVMLRYQTEETVDQQERDADIILDANPLFSATGPVGDRSAVLDKELRAMKEQLAIAKRQNAELKALKDELEAAQQEE